MSLKIIQKMYFNVICSCSKQKLFHTYTNDADLKPLNAVSIIQTINVLWKLFNRTTLIYILFEMNVRIVKVIDSYIFLKKIFIKINLLSR